MSDKKFSMDDLMAAYDRAGTKLMLEWKSAPEPLTGRDLVASFMKFAQATQSVQKRRK